jgi:hypothetical protein
MAGPVQHDTHDALHKQKYKQKYKQNETKQSRTKQNKTVKYDKKYQMSKKAGKKKLFTYGFVRCL